MLRGGSGMITTAEVNNDVIIKLNFISFTVGCATMHENHIRLRIF